MEVYIPQDIVGFSGIDGRAEKLIIGPPIVLTWNQPESESDKEVMSKTFNSTRGSNLFDAQFLSELDSVDQRPDDADTRPQSKFNTN